MAMVERVEKLGQLEHVLRQICRFGRGDALSDYIGSLGSGEPEFPDFISNTG
jgi:hypothetical protein